MPTVKSTGPVKFRLTGFRSFIDNKYYMRVLSRNNQIVLNSEGYYEKRGAERLLASLQEDGQFVGLSIQWESDVTRSKSGTVSSKSRKSGT